VDPAGTPASFFDIYYFVKENARFHKSLCHCARKRILLKLRIFISALSKCLISDPLKAIIRVVQFNFLN
jgi:hypothetical protein